jgi:hypothetical protein
MAHAYDTSNTSLDLVNELAAAASSLGGYGTSSSLGAYGAANSRSLPPSAAGSKQLWSLPSTGGGRPSIDAESLQHLMQLSGLDSARPSMEATGGAPGGVAAPAAAVQAQYATRQLTLDEAFRLAVAAGVSGGEAAAGGAAADSTQRHASHFGQQG